jgi:hypothetical protein
MPGEFFVCRVINGHPIAQRRADGYIDATALCKAAGMRWGDYSRRIATQLFLYRLAEAMGLPEDSLVERRPGRDGSTFVHPSIAIRFAQECNEHFVKEVTTWVETASTDNAKPATAPTADQIVDGLLVCRQHIDALVETRRTQIDLLRQVDETWQRVKEVRSHLQAVEG